MRSALLALGLTSSAFAAEMHVVPLGPTSATPIEVHYLSVCVPEGGHSVVRVGSEIRITALDPRCVQVLPIPMVESVKLPEVLPPGEYLAEVRLEGDSNVVAAAEFVVRNAGPKPFDVHPFVVAEGVPVRMSGVACDQAECADVSVRLGGETVEFTVDGHGAIWFTTPRLNEGLVDVSVQKSDAVSVSPGALYVSYDPERDLDVFERILFPVLFSADGAFGSKWRSEATVSNPRPWFLWNATTLAPVQPCIEGDCGRTIPPKHFATYGEGGPRGRLLWVSRPEAPDLALALRIRDVSRQAEGFGTQVPVVRERDMVHGTAIGLLDVPLDPRYRVKVRIYMIDPVLSPFLGGAVAIRRGETRLQLPFVLSRGGDRAQPYYAEVDLPPGVVGERVNVEIEMPLDAIGWAFASVTNNETQQVTIVAPQ